MGVSEMGSSVRVAVDEVGDLLAEFLRDVTDAPEVLWLGCLAMIEQAVHDAREARWGRFTSNPSGEMRRLEETIRSGLRLGDLAVAMSEAERERWGSIDDVLQEQVRETIAAERREQTLPAELARRVNVERRRRRREGLPASNVISTPEWQEAARRAIREGRPLPPTEP